MLVVYDALALSSRSPTVLSTSSKRRAWDVASGWSANLTYPDYGRIARYPLGRAILLAACGVNTPKATHRACIGKTTTASAGVTRGVLM
jgi:hypothetical protein